MTHEEGNLKKIFFEPVAPYFVTTYNTLISVVQGVALAALFSIIHEAITKSKLELLIACKVFIAFLIICLGWHSYITHNQYLAWQIRVRDTLVPMVFALLQILLILSILEGMFYFSLSMTALFSGGCIAYLNSMYHHGRPETEVMYKGHFSGMGDEFARDLLLEIYGFEKTKVREMLFMALISGMLTFFIYKDWVGSGLAIAVYITGFGPLFWRNLRNRLNKAPRLKKYSIQW